LLSTLNQDAIATAVRRDVRADALGILGLAKHALERGSRLSRIPGIEGYDLRLVAVLGGPDKECLNVYLVVRRSRDDDLAGACGVNLDGFDFLVPLLEGL